MQTLIEQGIPDPVNGLGSAVMAMTHRFQEILQPYPRLSRYIHLYHPDTQGPMDVCELLWGSGLFLDVIDQPDLVHALLHLISETYIRFLNAWYAIVGGRDVGGRGVGGRGVHFHWAMLHRGTIMLRDDSAMNFSPRLFEQFIEPYDQRLLDEFGGGAIHSCGRVDHYIHRLGQMRGVYAFNLSQPEYNDMEQVFRHTLDRGILLLALDRKTAESALARRRDLRGRVHCW